MSRQGWAILAACVLLGMAVVLLFGDEFRNEVLAFLRALARAL